MREHSYSLEVRWTGNLGKGTSEHMGFTRAHELLAAGKQPILASSDPVFRGDPARWNPEELLVAALSSCHMLWFLYLAAQAGIVVVGYHDEPRGLMLERPGGGGSFREVVLRPQ